MASLVSVGNDPLSAALGVIQSINGVLTVLIQKASTPQIDKLIQLHIDHLQNMYDFIDRLAQKIHHVDKPAVIQSVVIPPGTPK